MEAITVKELLADCMALSIIGCGDRKVFVAKENSQGQKLEPLNGRLSRVNEIFFDGADLPDGMTPEKAAENLVVLM